jgi:hypothetical protein
MKQRYLKWRWTLSHPALFPMCVCHHVKMALMLGLCLQVVMLTVCVCHHVVGLILMPGW